LNYSLKNESYDVLTIALIGFGQLKAQEVMKTIINESCTCIKDSKEKDEMKALINCAMSASIDYGQKIKKETGIDAGVYEGFTDFVSLLGKGMAQVCPNVTPSVFDEFKNKNASPSSSAKNELMICNTSGHAIMLAIGIKGQENVSVGWYKVESNTCQTFGNEIPEDVFYYYAFSLEEEIEWKAESGERFNLNFSFSEMFTISGDEGCQGCKSAYFQKYIPTNAYGSKAAYLNQNNASEFLTYRKVSRSKFKFCNQTNEDVLMAVGLDMDQKASFGWFVIKPNDCFEFDGFLPEELLHYYAFNGSGYEWKNDYGIKFKTITNDVFSVKENEYCGACEMISYRGFDFKNRKDNTNYQVVNFYLSDAKRPQRKVNAMAALFTVLVGAAILLDSGSGSSDSYSPSASDKDRKWMERQKQIDYDIRHAESRNY
jgi:uncharacterized membrane protein